MEPALCGDWLYEVIDQRVSHWNMSIFGFSNMAYSSFETTRPLLSPPVTIYPRLYLRIKPIFQFLDPHKRCSILCRATHVYVKYVCKHGAACFSRIQLSCQQIGSHMFPPVWSLNSPTWGCIPPCICAILNSNFRLGKTSKHLKNNK